MLLTMVETITLTLHAHGHGHGHEHSHEPEAEIRHMIHEIHKQLQNLTREVDSIRGDLNRNRQR